MLEQGPGVVPLLCKSTWIRGRISKLVTFRVLRIRGSGTGAGAGQLLSVTREIFPEHIRPQRAIENI